jgi:hypothetical protein
MDQSGPDNDSESDLPKFEIVQQALTSIPKTNLLQHNTVSVDVP